MTRIVGWIFLAAFAGILGFGQIVSNPSTEQGPFSGGIFLGKPPESGGSGLSSNPGPDPIRSFSGKKEKFEGLLARSDEITLSVQLADERVIRFQLDPRAS